jgi:hypothetical protein
MTIGQKLRENPSKARHNARKEQDLLKLRSLQDADKAALLIEGRQW